MGCVFDATHKKLGRRSALKFLATELVNSEEYVKRFLSEARIVNSVRHPNIVDIYDFIELEQPKRIAYVMEFVSGQSLGAILKERRLTIKQAVNVTFQLSDALQAVHARGVVHRDLKPDNVLITGDLEGDLSEVPSVKVLDFGIAKSSAASVEHRTVTGAILGTPSYMAPEQVAGHEVSSATDVYAIGEIFYEMVSGRRLFQGDRIQMMTQKLGGMAPSIELPDDLAGQKVILALIDHCLKVQPSERPTIIDVTGYMNELLAYQSEDIPPTLLTPLPSAPPDASPTPMAMASVAELAPPPKRSKLQLAAGASLILAIGVGGTTLLYKNQMLVGPTAEPLPPAATAPPPSVDDPESKKTSDPAATDAKAAAHVGTAAKPPDVEPTTPESNRAEPTPAKTSPPTEAKTQRTKNRRRRPMKKARRTRRRRAERKVAPKPKSKPGKAEEGSIIKKGTIPTW